MFVCRGLSELWHVSVEVLSVRKLFFINLVLATCVRHLPMHRLVAILRRRLSALLLLRQVLVIEYLAVLAALAVGR